MLARVSNIESFRRWEQDEDQTVEDLVRWITTDQPSEAMLAGTAFHKAMETAQDGDHAEFKANGYTFLLPNCELAIPSIRELRAYADYGDLTVTGQVDCLGGLTIYDHKTTSRFDAERYIAGVQWKFYLDLFGADVFRWNIFEIREVEPMMYEVGEPQVLEQKRYPELHRDCELLAARYLEFANQYLVGKAITV